MCERLKKGIRTMAPAFIIRLFFVCFFSAVSVYKILWLCCRIFSVLSAILYLGNITYRSKSTGRDEGLDVGPPEILATLSDLLKVAPFFVSMWHGASLCLTGCLRQLALICMGFFFFFQVKEELLVEALTKRKTVTVNDKLILPYSQSEVGTPHKDISATCNY